jgi:hypothetical protein
VADDAKAEGSGGRGSGRLRSRLSVALFAAVLGALLMLGMVVLGIGLGTGVFSPPGDTAGPTADGSVAPTPTTTASSSPASPSPTASPSPSPWPGEPDGTVYIVGNVELEVCNTGCTKFFDLDRNRGTVIAGQPETDVSATLDGLGMQNRAQVAAWGNREPPDLADCRAIADPAWTVPLVEVRSFEEGSSFCVRTDQDRYGYLQPQRSGVNEYRFYYVLWAHPDDDVQGQPGQRDGEDVRPAAA